MTDRRLQDRIAVVTGGAQGIGEGIVRRLVADGARVLIADLQYDRAAALADELNAAGASAAAARVDVADKSSVDEIPSQVEDAFGAPFDLLVCNAGVQTFQHAVDVSAEEWDRVLDVNARGTLFSMQMAARAINTDPTSFPAIVAMASIQARLGSPYYPHYSASKAAVLSLVRSFAVTLAPRGIRVNAVAPGVIDTPLWAVADEKISALKGVAPGSARESRIAAVPLGRMGTPEDVAASTSFLASSDASYITGECIHVSGGDVML
ncbi:SDR family NAD(P)-dependent oxidoreductase [Mycetocola zhujimingii]|uniref:SDR family NAD(P)-dependent oxidoreductase n=1 Tax=Mycetocola zhujimingii TaxID=2079792 RepID=UPI00215012A6|nr:glucose 1-dehydrogenase [Mycetocola zhujimingii]